MIFADTWAWVALALSRDQFHSQATAAHRRFVKQRRRYVTTDFVLSEVIAHLYSTMAPEKAQTFINALFESTDKGLHQLVHVSAGQFRRAWEMRQKYSDKPDISFVDFTSIVVMQDLGILDVFTGDQHFIQVNLGFRLAP
jgi:uncharacterized protein